jgi:acetyl esterase/lipase
VKELGVNPKDIVICGRSIGTGPAVFLSANRDPGALILISPFKSIQDTAKTILGMFNFLVADR